jgi:hypothetical protein
MSLARSNIVLTSVIDNGMLLIFDRYIHRSGNDMAADKQPEKTVNIQSSVNVGTATGEMAVSGAKVSVGVCAGDPRPRRYHPTTTTAPSASSSAKSAAVTSSSTGC